MARSADGILRVDAAEAELSDPAHSLHPLFVAFHAVITQIREAEPTDILLHADGGLSVRDPHHPSPTWLTLEQLREVLASCKQRGATVRMHRPRSPSPAAQVVLDAVDAQGVPVGDLPDEDELPEGVTTLHVACATPRSDIVQDLVQRGAHLEARDEYKNTPLLVACNHGSADVVAVLVSAGANVQALDGDGNSALMFAAQSKDARKVEILLAAGATVNHRGQGNLTALGIAAQYPDNPAIAPLLRAGATK
jgi:hypothetical protein